MKMVAGANPMNPPCLWNTTVLKFYEVADRKGTPVGAAPIASSALAPEAEMISRG